MTLRALFLAVALSWTSAAWAQDEPSRLVVDPVAGAAKPFDESLARLVAEEARALGLDASASDEPDAVLRLTGKAQARTARDGKGAQLGVRWTLRDAYGTELAAFSVEGIAPYQSKDPWEAIDGDTLRWLAAATARELETALESHDLQMSTVPLASAVPNTGQRTQMAPQQSEGSPILTRVFIAGVTGASGDGNEALVYALIQMLSQFEVDLRPKKEPGAYVIEGRVTQQAVSTTADSVSILWILKNAKNTELARIVQTNQVPKGTLAKRWGQTAVYAAEGAADGLLAAMGDLGPRPPGG